MALADTGLWEVSISFVDRNNNVRTTGFNLPGALEYDAAETSALAVVAAVNGISIAPITKWSMSRGQVDNAIDPSLADIAAQVEDKGVFTFKASNGQKSTFQIPAFDPSKVIFGTNTINRTDAAVITYINTMLNTALGAGNSPVTFLGADFTGVEGAPHKISKKNANG